MKWIDPMDKVPTNYPVAFRADVSVYDPDVYFYGQASEYKDLYDKLPLNVRWLSESTNKDGEKVSPVECMCILFEGHQGDYSWKQCIEAIELYRSYNLPSSKPEETEEEIEKEIDDFVTKTLTHMLLSPDQYRRERKRMLSQMQKIVLSLCVKDFESKESSQPSIEGGIRWVKASEVQPKINQIVFGKDLNNGRYAVQYVRPKEITADFEEEDDILVEEINGEPFLKEGWYEVLEDVPYYDTFYNQRHITEWLYEPLKGEEQK